MKLVVHFPPAFGEGPRSYAARLAAANHLTHMQLKRIGYIFSLDALVESRCLSTGPEHSLHREYIRAVETGVDTFQLALIERERRCCPVCMCHATHGLLAWELQFADACAEHSIWLIDRCSSCRRHLTWAAMNNRCECGLSYSAMQSKACPRAASNLSQFLKEAFFIERPIDEANPFRVLDIGQLQRFIRLLGCYGATPNTPKPRKLAGLARLENSWRITSVAAEIVDKWPDGFHAFLDQVTQHAVPVSKDGRLHGHFGDLYRALFRDLSEPEFEFVRIAFECYVRERWQGALGKRNRRFSLKTVEQANWISAATAMKVAGLSRQRFKMMVKTGKLESVSRTSRSGRLFVSIRRENISSLAADESPITLNSAREKLGLSKARCRALLPELIHDIQTPGLLGGVWKVSISELDQLCGKLESIPLLTDAASPQRSLTWLMQYGMLENTIALSLIQGALNLQIPIVGRVMQDGYLGGLCFRISDVVAEKKARPKPAGLRSVPDLATLMGIKQEVAYHLVRAGLFGPTQKDKKGRAQLVAEAGIESFKANYVFATTIAQLIKSSSRGAVKLLCSEGALPICSPDIDGCRQVLFRRNDLTRFSASSDWRLQAAAKKLMAVC